MRRDVLDFYKVKKFLSVYSPFKFVDAIRLISFSSRVVVGLDDGVNCDQANEIGLRLQKTWDDMCFGDITLRKAD